MTKTSSSKTHPYTGAEMLSLPSDPGLSRSYREVVCTGCDHDLGSVVDRCTDCNFKVLYIHRRIRAIDSAPRCIRRQLVVARRTRTL